MPGLKAITNTVTNLTNSNFILTNILDVSCSAFSSFNNEKQRTGVKVNDTQLLTV